MMRMRNRSFHNELGSALAVALIMTGVLISIGAAGLIVIKDKYRVVHQAASWEEALHSAEGGVEVALTELRRQFDGQAPFQSAGWTSVSADQSHRYGYESRDVMIRQGEGGTVSWTVVQVDAPPSLLDTTGEQWYRIRSHGFCRLPGGQVTGGSEQDLKLRKLSLAHDRYNDDSVMDGGPVAHRVVEAIAKPMSAFRMALFGKRTIDMTDHNIVVDSYDSRDTTKSTNGFYDVNKRQWRGDIGTNGTVINAGNAHIYGTANTNEGSVLNADNVTGHFQDDPDRIRDDFSIDLAKVIAPSEAEESTTTGTPTAITGNTTIQGVSGTIVVARVSRIALSGSNALTLAGESGKITDIHIIVSGNISLTGQSQIVVGAGVRVRVFVAGDTDIAGNGVANPNSPLNFQLYGTDRALKSDGSEDLGIIKIAGNGGFRGSVYAPNYDVEIKGGGNSDSVYGAFVGNTVRMTGVQSVHYDEALGDGGIISGYSIVSWFEDER